MTKFEVTAKLTSNDLAAWWQMARARARDSSWPRMLGGLLASAFTVLAAWGVAMLAKRADAKPDEVTAAAILATFFFGLLCFSSFLKVVAYRSTRNRFLTNVTSVYQILEHGVSVVSPTMQSVVSWEGIVEVAGSSDHLFVILQNETALIIPKRDFLDAANAAAFAAELKRRWNDARQKG